MQKNVLCLALVFAFNFSLSADEDFSDLEGKSVDEALDALGSNDNNDNWHEGDVPMMGDPDYYVTVHSRGEYRDEAPPLAQIVIPRMTVLIAQAHEARARKERRRQDRRERRYERAITAYWTRAK